MKLGASAKVNLALQVFPAGRDGFHPLRSWAVSVLWLDDLLAEWSEDGDEFTVDGPACTEELPIDESNLVWQAVRLARKETGSDRPLKMALTKHIPVGAGLAGGSADAAAALVALDRMMGTTMAKRRALVLGSDVPFCVTGGSALMEGRGELLTDHPAPLDLVLGIVVPPFQLATREVYRHWDRLGEPEGDEVPDRRLPPSLRDGFPIRNDLYPAARSLAPDLDEWRSDLEARWARPVLMSGSGSALFGFFADLDEAAAAVEEAPAEHRGARAAPFNSTGVAILDR